MSNYERVNITNEDGEIIATASREQAEHDNSMTENVLVFVFNSLGKVWIHRRPDNKRHYPGLWDISACGGVISGETPIQAAHREQLEEMGFTCDLTFVNSFVNTFLSEHGGTRRRLSHVFLGISDQEPQKNADAAEFASISHGGIVDHVGQNEDLFVPSFIAEYEQVHDAYIQLSENQ